MFDEGVGPVQVDFLLNDDRPSNLFMHQPLLKFLEILQKVTVAKLLSLEAVDIMNDYPVQIVSCGVPLILVPLRSLDAVRRARVRTDLLETELQHVDSKEFFVFTQETTKPSSNVHCRMFAPRFGIPEDPATGGAHGPLGAYLFKYKLTDAKKIRSEQGLEMGRPSEITDVLVGSDCTEVGTGTIQIAGTT